MPSQEPTDDLSETINAINATHDAAKAIGLGKGKGGSGSLTCPKCKTGTINYSVASLNGHIWGACTTKGCVRWME